MKPIVTVIATGGMGSALGGRLVEKGLDVRTSLTGRSAASCDRARAAGLNDVGDQELVDVDLILSVVPPSQALPLAQRIAQISRNGARQPIYVDCNAVNPATARDIAAEIEAAGITFVDGGIIGGPPREGYAPKLFVSGSRADAVVVLADYGLNIPVLDGPIGAASALKMSYAGITKGIIATASAMILAAERAGAGEALRDELSKSQVPLFNGFSRGIPDSFGKARRWAPEMDQIAGFANDSAAEKIYGGFAEHYRRLADDVDGDHRLADILRQFFVAQPS